MNTGAHCGIKEMRTACYVLVLFDIKTGEKVEEFQNRMSNVSDKVKDSFRSEAMVYDADPVSMEVLQLMELAFGCVLIHVFALLGLAGATINIIVLSSQNITTDSSNILLISLSVADFVFCLTIPIW